MPKYEIVIAHDAHNSFCDEWIPMNPIEHVIEASSEDLAAKVGRAIAEELESKNNWKLRYWLAEVNRIADGPMSRYNVKYSHATWSSMEEKWYEHDVEPEEIDAHTLDQAAEIAGRRARRRGRGKFTSYRVKSVALKVREGSD